MHNLRAARVRSFLDQHGIGWVTNLQGQGTYAALQDVCAFLGGFWSYQIEYADAARDRRRQPRLPGRERWIRGEPLVAFLEATKRPAAEALLIGDEDRLSALLDLGGSEYEHDAMKDEIALLCTFAGIPVHNEIPLAALGGPTQTRRPDLCLWMEDEIWVVDIKTQVGHHTIEEMVARDYPGVVKVAHGQQPDRLILVSGRRVSTTTAASALMHGWEIIPFAEFKQLILERIRQANRLCPPNFQKVAARF